MKMKNTALMLLVLAVGTVAIARQERTTATDRPGTMEAAELERLAAEPSLEQGILQAVAERLRQEKRPMTTVEIPLTARVTKITGPFCHYQTCVTLSNNHVVCKIQLCNSTK